MISFQEIVSAINIYGHETVLLLLLAAIIFIFTDIHAHTHTKDQSH